MFITVSGQHITGYLMVCWLWFMVFNATFNNISVISWWWSTRRKPQTCRKLL